MYSNKFQKIFDSTLYDSDTDRTDHKIDQVLNHKLLLLYKKITIVLTNRENPSP